MMSNLDRFNEAAGSSQESYSNIAHYCGTTVEDCMCAVGSWQVELLQRWKKAYPQMAELRAKERIEQVAPDMLNALKAQVALRLPIAEGFPILSGLGWNPDKRGEFPATEFANRLARDAIAKATLGATPESEADD